MFEQHVYCANECGVYDSTFIALVERYVFETLRATSWYPYFLQLWDLANQQWINILEVVGDRFDPNLTATL